MPLLHLGIAAYAWHRLQRSESTHLDLHVSQPSLERGRRLEFFETAENVVVCGRDLGLPSLAAALFGPIPN